MAVRKNPAVQATEVEFTLHTLGWKAFQDLSAAIASEILGRPVQTFLTSKDGGRDAAFVGTWEGAENLPQNKSTIQCKFIGKPDAKLSLSHLKTELPKAEKLAKDGLAHDYIIITNAKVSAELDAEVAAAFESVGVKRCRTFGYNWLTQTIRASPRLRMMVPRLYGLGDLSQIIDQRAYDQAKYVLSSMGDDLRCFVITDAHRKSVSALTKHGFVLLLGDPASGKSTIGASLAIGALDNGSIGTIKATSPDDFKRHWNPKDPNQFFWMDDAFGPTQYQRTLVDSWNHELPLLKAALKAGTRILFTSRNYIWQAAKRDLKVSQFPLLGESQVVINVQSLSETERAQILYNHIRSGDQPKQVRSALKPHLARISRNPNFLPETARRLGSRFFTSGLAIETAAITAFVERPVEFLKDVLRNLDDGGRAAVALIFLSGSAAVQSPLAPSEALDTVCRLYGLNQAALARGLENLSGSLTLLIQTEAGSRWTYKHPTIADAFASLVAESAELVELYIQGAKIERLLAEIVCGDIELRGASVRVSAHLFDRVVERITAYPLDRNIKSFLTYRCDRHFRKRYFDVVGFTDDLIDYMSSELAYDTSANLIARLNQDGILPEELRSQAAAKIMELTIEMPDGAVFDDDDIRSILTDEEFEAIYARFNQQVAERLDDYASELERSIVGDVSGVLMGLKENMERYVRFQKQQPTGVSPRLIKQIEEIEERAAELERETPQHEGSVMPHEARALDKLSEIFDDVDD